MNCFQTRPLGHHQKETKMIDLSGLISRAPELKVPEPEALEMKVPQVEREDLEEFTISELKAVKFNQDAEYYALVGASIINANYGTGPVDHAVLEAWEAGKMYNLSHFNKPRRKPLLKSLSASDAYNASMATLRSKVAESAVEEMRSTLETELMEATSHGKFSFQIEMIHLLEDQGGLRQALEALKRRGFNVTGSFTEFRDHVTSNVAVRWSRG